VYVHLVSFAWRGASFLFMTGGLSLLAVVLDSLVLMVKVISSNFSVRLLTVLICGLYNSPIGRSKRFFGEDDDNFDNDNFDDADDDLSSWGRGFVVLDAIMF